VVDRVKICLASSLITVQYLVVVSRTVCTHVGGSKKFLGTLGWDVTDVLEARCYHVLYYIRVTLGQTVWA